MESQRRNFRGELLTALAAISMLGLAIVFAVVLTADTMPGGSAEPSPTVASMVPTQAPTSTPAASDTPIPPSATTEATEALPTTAAPSATTATEALAVTATSAATASPRASATPIPSATPKPTETAVPTQPPTRTPTSTSSPTNTPSVTPSRTPAPTQPRTATPTLTLTPLVVSTTAGTCTPPAGWQPYAIQSGDNLFRLAMRAGLSTTELQQANCIANAASITTGQVIYVPPVFFTSQPVSSTPVPGTVPSGATSVSPGSTTVYPLSLGCLLTQIRFSSPAPGSTLSGRITLRGTATLSDLPSFNYYKVEIRGVDGFYHNLAQSANPAPGPDSTLALLDTTSFASGEYQLRLTVVDQTGNYPEPCAIRVYLHN